MVQLFDKQLLEELLNCIPAIRLSLVQILHYLDVLLHVLILGAQRLLQVVALLVQLLLFQVLLDLLCFLQYFISLLLLVRIIYNRVLGKLLQRH